MHICHITAIVQALQIMKRDFALEAYQMNLVFILLISDYKNLKIYGD